MVYIGEWLAGSIAAGVLFGIPGWLMLRLTGFARQPGIWLGAPLAGIFVAGPFLHLACYLAQFSISVVLTSWSFLVALLVWMLKRYPDGDSSFCQLTLGKLIGILLLVAVWALFPISHIFPIIWDNGLYFRHQIFDHSKIALVDAICRNGLPAVSPYYAVDGIPVPLNYYYHWHFLAAVLKKVTGISGWLADVALTWYTAFAGVLFLCAIAIRLAKDALAAVWLLLFCLCGNSFMLLGWLFDYKFRHALELLWMQLVWSPQHMFACFAVVMMVFFLALFLSEKKALPPYVFAIGGLGASALGSSVWVGGVALGFAFPWLVGGLLVTGISRDQWKRLVLLFALAGILALIFSLPVLVSMISGPHGQTTDIFPIAFKLYIAETIPCDSGIVKKFFYVALFFLVYVPFDFGLLMLGAPALAAYRGRKGWAGYFKTLSICLLLGYVTVVGCVRSVIQNNDLAWRSAGILVMVLSIWTATACAGVLFRPKASQDNDAWSPRSLLVRWRSGWLVLFYAGLTIGLLGTMVDELIWNRPLPVKKARVMYRQIEFWEEIQRISGPDDLVAINPDGFLGYTLWPTNIPWCVMGDRSTIFSAMEYVHNFSRSFSMDDKMACQDLLRRVYSGQGTQFDYAELVDHYKVDLFVVTRFDPCWNRVMHQGILGYRLVFTGKDGAAFRRVPSGDSGR